MKMPFSASVSRIFFISFSLFALDFSHVLAASPAVLGAIGDSISVACNAVNLGDNLTYSWSTGTDAKVNSHLKRLGSMLQNDIQGVNFAVTGAKLADLGPQVESIIAHKPNFLTIEIGANDLCSWTTDDPAKIIQFGGDLRGQIAKVVESNPDIRILLASIPDIYGLWEVGSRRRECQFRWDFFGICAPMLSSRVTAGERSAFVDRWRAVNATLLSVAQLYPKNVVFNGSVAAARIAQEHISSLDCFHPSAAGQDFLAEKAWPYMVRLVR